MENFCLTVPKTFVGEPLPYHFFRVPEKFGEEPGGGFSRFYVENFCLTVPKIFVGETSDVALI